jgi:hypothetical protein
VVAEVGDREVINDRWELKKAPLLTGVPARTWVSWERIRLTRYGEMALVLGGTVATVAFPQKELSLTHSSSGKDDEML